MSELTQLTGRITLPGCTLHKCGLQIDGAISPENEQGIAHSLDAVGGSALWWWGDFLCHLGKRYGQTYAEAAEKSSYSPDTLRDAKWVCSKYQFSYRYENLSYKHHIEALKECDGDAAKALEWLGKARDAGWSVSEMRQKIRQAGATHDKSEEGPPQSSMYDSIKEIDRWSRQLDGAPAELLRQVDSDLTAIRQRVRAQLVKVEMAEKGAE